MSRLLHWLRSLPPESTRNPTRPQIFIWLGIVAASLGLSLSNYPAIQVGVTRDDAEYVILTWSIARADQYGLINAPGAPAPTRFPFGFPLLLAPIELLAPGNFEVLKFLSLAATLGNTALLFWGWPWLFRSWSHWWALATTALYALAPMIVGQTRIVMSEPVFLTLILAAAILTEQLGRSVPARIWALPLGAVLTLTIFTRTIGLVVLAIIVLYLLVCRGRAILPALAVMATSLALTLIAIIAVSPVTWRDLAPAEYFGQFTDPARFGQTQIETPLLERLLGALQEYGSQHLRLMILPLGGGDGEQALFAQWGLSFLPGAAGLAISLLILIGLGCALIRTRAGLMWWLALVYGAAIVFWPWRGPRFLYPIQPQIMLAFLLGSAGSLNWLLTRLPNMTKHSRQLLLQGGLAVMLAGLLSGAVYKSLRLENSLDYVGDLSLRTAWLRQHTTPDSIVLTEDPAIDYIYGLRPTVAATFTKEQEFKAYLRANRVAYVLIAPEVVWQGADAPHYSQKAQQMQTWLSELVRTGEAQLAYDSQTDLIQVFEITP